MLRSSKTPFVILGILGILDPKPLSGYDIKHILDGTISHFWSESFGQIYPVLRRLAAEKLIRAVPLAGSNAPGGRKKIVYAITARGKKRLAAWMELPPERGPARDELVLKLFFGSMTQVPVLTRHLAAQRDRAKAFLDQYSGWAATLQMEKEPNTPFQLITLRGGIAMCAAFIQWADESLAALNKLVKR